MCSIFGALLHGVHTEQARNAVNADLLHVWKRSAARGRDGRGYMKDTTSGGYTHSKTVDRVELKDSETLNTEAPRIYMANTRYAKIIGNMRAEPTTEFVADKKHVDQQPYRCGNWTIVHNGTIANDKELRSYSVPTRIDSAAIAEHLDRWGASELPAEDQFYRAMRDLKGSFAIIASHASEPDTLYVACNYRPVWYAQTEHGTFFASARDYFPVHMVPQMVTPYSVMVFRVGQEPWRRTLHSATGGDVRALVVCSGGLDSVVAAVYAQKRMGLKPHLIHFQYGSRAEGPEVEAVKAVAAHIGAPLTLFPLPVYSKGDSPLLDADAKVAGGEAGAEFAHEWVPARNLVMLSVATAFAEARGIQTIVLGNNLEEAGAYPDNEPEFINKFNDLLPFAVGDGKRMRVLMPVGNLMKHEIVALGHEIAAPMHLTWSCYRAGAHHCGQCGPCFMRRTAFEINKLPEVIKYVPVN